MKKIFTSLDNILKYRSLIWQLTLNDLKIRYRNPVLGFLWSIIMPLVMSLIFKFVFSNLLRSQISDYPFYIYLIVAIFPWSYFSSSVFSSVESIVNNRELIKKSYFPREIIPFSIVLANLINFIPVILIMLLIIMFYGLNFSLLVFLLPFVVLLETVLILGVSLLVSSLQVFLRDIKYIVQLVLTAWLYFSPAFYSLDLVVDISDWLLRVYILNPFTGIFTLYRIVLLEGFMDKLPTELNLLMLIIWTIFVSFAIFFIGFYVFRKNESKFVDLL